jgi:acyl-CoA synthetase
VVSQVPSALEVYGPTRVQRFYDENIWSDTVLAHVIGRWADEIPDQPAIFDGDVEISWSELKLRSDRLAGHLRELGIGRQDRVGIQLPNWWEFVVAHVALARIGVVTVPLMPVYRQHEVAYIAETTQMRAVFTPGTFRRFDYWSMWQGLRGSLADGFMLVGVRLDSPTRAGEYAHAFEGEHVHVFEDLAEPSGAGIDESTLGEPPGPDDVYLIGFTSGTESRPKGCVHTWNTYSFTPRQCALIYDVRQDDVELALSPVAHTAGLAAGVIKPFLAGAATCMIDKWDPLEALRLLGPRRVSSATGATVFAEQLVANAGDDHDLSSFRYFTCGGAPIPAGLGEKVAEVLGAQLLANFGQTETLCVTSQRLDEPTAAEPGNVGWPLAGAEVRVVAGGTPTTDGEGEIEYRGPGGMLGYWNDPAKTAAVMRPDGWRATGDLGRIAADGSLIVTGRLKEIIIRGGMNISALEIEELLLSHPIVAEVAVVGMPDSVLGERVCAAVVVADGHDQDPAVLLRFLSDECHLAKQKLPEKFVFFDALPRTATGKVAKADIRSVAASQAA